MSLSPPVIEVETLCKRFGDIEAVRDVSFSIARGEICGLLGPNGAGKTTTIQLLLGITTPTSGRIRILGLDPARDRRAILSRSNFSSAYVALPSNLTVHENLSVFSRLYGRKPDRARFLRLLDAFDVAGVIDSVTGALSSGQQTRVNLCKAFLNDPEILFLDEPTASLDPEIAARVRERLLALQRERGVTMVYTSHNMRDVELMCDRVLFMTRGRIAAAGTPPEILSRAGAASLEDVFITIARDGSLVEPAARPEGA